MGRSLRGNVDRNIWSTSQAAAIEGRSLRGNVDRNILTALNEVGQDGVVPYVGTWIEIMKREE